MTEGSGRAILPSISIGSVRIRVKENLSRRLLATALELASECERIEREQSALDWPQEGWERLQGLAVTTVVTAVAALEASINELYLQAADRSRDALESLTDEHMALLEALWPTVEWTRGILNKYQVALTACGKAPFDKGAEPWQSAAGLVRLRNALVHFKPEWRDEQREHKKLEELLSSRFPENALSQRAKGSMTWFQGRCLGAGCAMWACDTVTAFAAHFASRLGVRDRF